jgi:Transcriptional regulators
MRLLKALRENECFSPTEQIIVDYLFKNYREVAYLSVRQLAEKTYTSSAAVVRFCQKLGLKGYAEFKIKFVAEAMRDMVRGNDGSNSITNKDDILSIIDKVTRIEVDAIQETRRDTDPAVIMRAVQLLDHANHIDFYAIGNNLHIADLAGYCFLHAGKFYTTHHAANELYLQAISSPKQNVAFLISRTGENRRLLELAEILKKRETKIMLLTAARESSIGRLADEVLCVATEKNFNELGSMVFLVGAKYMVDILFSVLMARHYDTTLTKNEFYEKIFSSLN